MAESAPTAVSTAVNHRDDFLLGDWLVQPSLGVISRGGVARHLEPKAMEVLICLAAHAGKVASKDELMRVIWPDTFVSDHVLTHAIWKLRQLFADDEFIQTISRRGYRLTVSTRAADNGIRSLAVLPLLNFSGDPEQEYFAEGATEALISALAQIAALRVISRTSVMQYKGTNKRAPEIAAELNVDGIVEGSVIRAGHRVRITVQLIHAASDRHVWAKSYDRDLRDVLQLQDEMARTIAAELQIKLTPQEHARLDRPRPVNSAAYEAYLKGRYCYFRSSQDGAQSSIAYMRQAISCDPDYALAYAGLADAASVLAVTGGMPPKAANSMMEPALARALEIDPALAEAYVVLGWKRLFHDWDWTGAEAMLRRALALNPSSSAAYATLAQLCDVLGRPADALTAWQHARDLDPLSLFYMTLRGATLVLARRPAEAVEQLRSAIRVEPHYWLPHEILGFALVDLARYQEAILAAETAVELAPDPVPKAALGYVYSHAGRQRDARRILQDVQQLSRTRYLSPLLPAALMVALGDHESALDLIEKALETREPVLVLIRIFPFWRPLHAHPRFQEVVRQMNFPD